MDGVTVSDFKKGMSLTLEVLERGHLLLFWSESNMERCKRVYMMLCQSTRASYLCEVLFTTYSIQNVSDIKEKYMLLVVVHLQLLLILLICPHKVRYSHSS